MKVLHCKQCDKDFRSHTDHPVKCGTCGSKRWQEDEKAEERYQELPKVDHSVLLRLKAGNHCPYESQPKSHTVILSREVGEIRYYCASCDAVFDKWGYCLGVVAGIGVRR